MKLYNTLTKTLEEVKPNSDGVVTMYNCGPTVYSMQHIGNYRAYANWDILHRSLIFLGYNVQRIMNITDVGHLTSDEDTGEDKMEKGAKALNLSDPYQVADYYIKTFLSDMYALNMLSPKNVPYTPDLDTSKMGDYGWIRATQTVQPMIELIKEMEKNNFVYETPQAVYFDVTKYNEYTKLSGQRLEDKFVGVRDDVNTDSQKKHPADFVLWMKRYGVYENHIMYWESPWGDGFPGWHLECSAMGIKYLGSEISIHTGGIEHIPVHHTNERAQNFGALEKEVVTMWVHNEHLQATGGTKLSKSLGNAYTIPQLVELGYSPLDIRYLLISANYRIPLKFSLSSLDAARNTLKSIKERVAKLKLDAQGRNGNIIEQYNEKFGQALGNDLNISLALSIFTETLKSKNKPEDILATVYSFDTVLGLNLNSKEEKIDIPNEVLELLELRKEARSNKDFNKSDELRDRISQLGYLVKDTSNGQKIEKK